MWLRRRSLAVALGSLVALVVVIAPAPVAAVDININSAATYLRTDPTDVNAADAVAIDLTTLGLAAGDIIQLTVLGDYRAAFADTDTRTDLLAVFSGSSTLLADNQQFRVQDAADAGADVTTLVTFPGTLATDIPEDFLVTPQVQIQIPVGATHLFLSTNDNFFGDNTDPDGDFKLRITSSAVPEPSSLLLLGAGLTGVAIWRWRK
jgi:hypothetical protein